MYLSGPYLIVITSKEKVGEIRGNSIWRVTGTEMHSYKRTTMHLTEKQVGQLVFDDYLRVILYTSP